MKQELVRFKLVPKLVEEKLAILYQTPKFHKDPPKFRYIAGNISTVVSGLDGKIANVLKMCKEHFKNLCNKNREYSGVRYFFDVITSIDVKNMLDNLQGKARSISINDFSTLYTLFNHDHLLGNISWMLSKLARNSGCSYISIGHEKAWWSRQLSDKYDTYSCVEVLEMIEFLVRNCYIKAFGKVFRQDRGMIMGGKSSGGLADCSLMVDEYRYVDRKVKDGSIEEAKKLENFRRYRDDCTVCNVDSFLDIAQNIYPDSLSLTQENDDSSQANVLDMQVNIIDNSIITKVYCKTDYFPFHVISLPFLDSNIAENISYLVFYSQVLRYQRLSSNKLDFNERCRQLVNILLARDYKLGKLKKEFCRVVDKFRIEFMKWNIPDNLASWFHEIVR